ncbi:MAG: FAD-dependent oxidoreductase [Leptolinea sp.]|nr:FAD-dependent oxidoreductase [Leptolinea sp.]
MYDVIIIGGGPAGATAAIYTARAGLNTLVVDKGLTAGALGITGKIANYPGVSEPISGADLLEQMRRQAESFGAKFVFDRVVGADLTSPEKIIFANQGTYSGRTVIIATGSMGRGSRIKGEDRLLGKGVSYCATCDGAFFRDKEVIVAGSTDEAIEEALFLTRFASRVHFLSPTPELKAPRKMIDELEKNIRVNLVKGVSLSEILGENKVEGARFAKRGMPEEIIQATGAFIYLQGGKPVTDFLMGQLALSESGCLSVDAEFQTAIPGVYAVGDVLCDHIKQAVVAASEGAVAAIALEKNLRGRSKMTVDWAK